MLGASLPILHETSALIADPQVRYLGTLGGNVANGDPGNDMPALMMCLGATYHVMGKSGTRDRGARILSGRLFHRARARRRAHRRAHSGAARPDTATPTKNSSARSAITRPRPPPWC